MRILLAATIASALAAGTGAFASGDMDAVLGKALFERDWVPAPTSTDASDGLGPLFSARSCKGCHSGPALSARFTDTSEGRIAGRGLVVRFGDADGRPDPLYGHLLQVQAVEGMQAEGRIVLMAPSDPDGPLDIAMTLDRGPLDAATQKSVRIAPPLAGRAELDRIDAAAVLALADPDDGDRDGISGRARMIGVAGTPVLGRYGWKAGTTDLEEQIADAFAMDIGLSSDRRPFPHGDCTSLETDCTGAPTGESSRLGGREISPEMIDLVAAYLRSVPAQRDAGSADGERLFASLGCGQCHQPEMPSADGGLVTAYTDLLLHDMGSELNDGVGEPGVASSEWRTAPLIAMRPSQGRRYLHDGRATNLDLAIRAHGGEADAARSRYLALSDDGRQALVAFVESL